MPALNWYLNNSPATGAHKLLATSSSGSAATTTTGWVVAKNGASTYARMDCGVERSGAFTGTAQPSGAPDTAAPWDCFRLDDGAGAALNGIFVSGAWTFRLLVRSVTAVAATGRCRFRLWKSANVDGSSATEITAGVQIGSTVTLSTTVTQTTSVTTASITGFTLTNEYLFLQIAWENVTAGSSNSSDVDIRSSEGTAFCTSPSFGALQAVTNGTIDSGSVVRVPSLTYTQNVTNGTISSGSSLFSPTTYFDPPAVAGSGATHVSASSPTRVVDLSALGGAPSTGDQWLVFYRQNSTVGPPTFPAGWTKVVEQLHASAGYLVAYARIVQSGDPTSITVTNGATSANAWVVYRITANTFVVATQANHNPDGAGSTASSSTTVTPPSLNPAQWGLGNALWIVTSFPNAAQGTVTAPSGYTTHVDDNGSLPIYSSWKTAAATSDTPGAFTGDTLANWCAATVALDGKYDTGFVGNFAVLDLGAIASGAQLYAATVAQTAPTITSSFISSGSSVAAPTVAYELTNGTIASGSAVSAPTTAYALTNGTVASTATLAAPTVTPGAVTVTGATIASGSTLFAATAAYAVTGATLTSASILFAPTATYLVTGAFISSTVTLYTPTATHIAAGAFISSTTAVFAPTSVAAEQAVTAATVSSTTTLTAPSTAYALTAATRSSTTTLAAPTVAIDQAVTNGTITSTLALYTATVLADQAVTTATLTSSSMLSAPAVTPPAQSVTTAAVSTTTTVAAPSVAYEATTAHIASTATTAAPTVAYAVSAPSIAATTTLTSPTVTTLTFVTAATVPSTLSLYEPLVQLASGPQAVLGAHLSSTVTLSAPIVTPPVASVTGATVSSTSTLTAPTVAYALTTGTVTTTVTLTSPTVTPGAVTVLAAFIASTTTLYGESIVYTVTTGTIIGAPTVNPPTVTPGAVTVVTSTVSAESLLFAPSIFSADEIELAHIASTLTVHHPRKVYHVHRRHIDGLLASDAASEAIIVNPGEPLAPLSAATESHDGLTATSTVTRNLTATTERD